MAELPPQIRQLPPWNGPPQGPPIQPTLGPAERPSSFPFESPSHDMYPPVCIRSHWDAESIIRRTLPTVQLATPLDPRPWTKICMNYVTTQEFEEAPRPDNNMVMPSGGTVYPPSRYREAIDNESELRGLDRPLGTCEADQYKVPLSGDMYRPNSTVDRKEQNSRFVQELSFPMACMRNSDYDCRSKAQQEAWARSGSLFNNATKQERYAVTQPGLVKRPSDPVHDQRQN
jgi:hypothetical protein